MIGTVLALALSATLATSSLVGVDPNTLSCDPRGQVFLLLPHFTDCNKYYMCAHGAEVEWSCAGNTIFDFHLQTCNWDWATQCWLRTRASSTESVQSSESQEEVEPEQSGELADVDPNTLSCDPAGQVHLLLPHFVECSKFYMCDHGNEVERSCAGNTIFDFPLQTCNWDWATKCWLRTRPSSSESHESAEPDQSSSNESTQTSESQSSEETAESSESNETIESETSSNESGLTSESPESNQSESEESGQSNETEESVTPEYSASVEGSGSEEGESASSEELGGSGEGPLSVEGSGDDLFNEDSMAVITVGASKLNCINVLTASKQIPYHGNCQQYWRCTKGRPEVRYCADGLYFNPKTEQCDYEANVKCFADEIDELEQGEFLLY